MCKQIMTKTNDDEGIAITFSKAIDVFYNSTGELKENCIDSRICSDLVTKNLNLRNVWLFQYCTELTMTNCLGLPSGTVTDGTECIKEFITSTKESCLAQFNSEEFGKLKEVDLGFHSVEKHYGLNVDSASNIIFT